MGRVGTDCEDVRCVCYEDIYCLDVRCAGRVETCSSIIVSPATETPVFCQLDTHTPPTHYDLIPNILSSR